jgi:N-acetylglucosaminyldiphosphoundecaprenol N-acetyl-beta-D-mannosaminyltransferase
MGPEHTRVGQFGAKDPVVHTDFRRPVYCLLGLPFDAVGSGEALRRIGVASPAMPCFLSTPNLNFLITSHQDPAFRNSVIRSDLSVADGMPLVWIASLLGIPIRERVAGSDLFDALVLGEGRPLKVFFFGGPEGAAGAACARLNAMAKPTRCVGFISPGFGTVEQLSDPQTIAKINRSGADFIVVALGARKGQAWIERNRAALQAPVISHLGAVVNFAAGTLTRAPVVMQRLGLEWIWRIKEEPVLWRRYSGDALALGRLMITRVLPVAVARILGGARRGCQPACASIDVELPWTRLALSGNWTLEDLPALQDACERIMHKAGEITLDLTGLGKVDQAFVGCLMLLYGHQSKLGRSLLVSLVGEQTRRVFRLHCAEFLLDGIELKRGAPPAAG